MINKDLLLDASCLYVLNFLENRISTKTNGLWVREICVSGSGMRDGAPCCGAERESVSTTLHWSAAVCLAAQL